MPFELKLDYERGVPVYRQIYEAITHALSNGRLQRGEKMPTIHDLAETLRINPNTVAHAYRELERDGFLQSFRGKGTFSSPTPPIKKLPSLQKRLGQIYDDAVRAAVREGISTEELCDFFAAKISIPTKAKS